MMNKAVNANCAYARLAENIESFAMRGISPEVFFSADALDSLDHNELAVHARRIREAGLSPTIHAAFIDLNPGTLDAAVRRVTRARFEQVFDAAAVLRPKTIVFHPGYDELRYGDYRAAWLENSISFWQELLPRAREIDCVIAVENIFEKEPSTLRDLLEAVNDSHFRHCFDTGHWNMFKTVSMEEWFAELGRYVVETHIHDNHGQTDQHLPLGEGTIDFDLLFGLLNRYAPDAIWTIEAHTDERRERALDNIKKYATRSEPFE